MLGFKFFQLGSNGAILAEDDFDTHTIAAWKEEKLQLATQMDGSRMSPRRPLLYVSFDCHHVAGCWIHGNKLPFIYCTPILVQNIFCLVLRHKHVILQQVVVSRESFSYISLIVSYLQYLSILGLHSCFLDEMRNFL